MQNEKSKIDSNSYQLAEHLSMLATCVAFNIDAPEVNIPWHDPRYVHAPITFTH